MARLTNWVENLARGRKRVCTMESWGMGFDNIGAKPNTICVTFSRSKKPPITESIEIELSPDEVDKLMQNMADFKARRA